MYYTVIKHDGRLRTRTKCRKREQQGCVFECSQMSVVFYQSVIHGLGFFIFYHDDIQVTDVAKKKTLKRTFPMFKL